MNFREAACDALLLVSFFANADASMQQIDTNDSLEIVQLSQQGSWQDIISHYHIFILVVVYVTIIYTWHVISLNSEAILESEISRIHMNKQDF